jgi:hypothetical protein
MKWAIHLEMRNVDLYAANEKENLAKPFKEYCKRTLRASART